MAIIRVFDLTVETHPLYGYVYVDYDEQTGALSVYVQKKYFGYEGLLGLEWDSSWYLIPTAADPRIAGMVMQDRTGLISAAKSCIGLVVNGFAWQAAYPYVNIVPTTEPCGLAFVPPSPIVISHTPTPQQNELQPDGSVTFETTNYRPIRIRLTAVGENGLFPPASAQNYGAQVESDNQTVFANLYPGWYAVSAMAYDPVQPLVQVSQQFYGIIYIPPFSLVAYNVYASGGFQSRYGEIWTLKILKRGYIGTVRQFCMMGDLMKLYYRGTIHEGLYSNVNGLSVDFTLVGDTIRDWTDIYTNDDREFLVEVAKNTVMQFRGYLLPDTISQEHDRARHAVRFTATDGLGTSKDRPLPANLVGKKSLTDIVKTCVAGLGLAFEVHWYIEQAPFTGLATLDVSVFEPETTCFQALTHILEKFSARISQVNGVFLIEQPYSLSESETFQAGGTTYGRYSRSACRITATDENILLARQSVIEIYPAAEAVVLNTQMHPRPLALSDLTDPAEWQDIGIVFFTKAFPRAWQVQGEVFDRRSTDGTAVEGASFYVRNNREANTESSISHITPPLFWDETGSLFVSFRIFHESLPTISYARFTVAWAGFFLNKTGDAWVSLPDYLEYKFTSAEMGKDITVNFKTPPLPMPPNAALGYPISIVVYQPYHDQQGRNGEANAYFTTYTTSRPYVFKQLDVRLLLGGNELQSLKTQIHTNTGKYNLGTIEINRFLGEWMETMPNKANVKYAYPYSTQLNGEPVMEWTDVTAFTSKSLADFAFRSLVFARSVNRERLLASIKGTFVFYKKLVILPDNNSTYFCNSLEIDPFNDSCSGEFVFVSGQMPVPLYRTLENGILHLKEDGKGSFFEQSTYQ